MKCLLWIRLACIVNGILYFVVGALLFAKVGWATSLWPWPDAAMSYIFLASIAAAIGAPLIWIGVSGELAAFAGLGLNTFAVNACAAAYVAVRSMRGDIGAIPAIGVCAAVSAAGLFLYAWSRRIPVNDARPMPGVVRWAFAGFAATLIATGSALVFQVPRIFPWDLAAPSSTMFGFIFLGAAIYFAHGVLHPQWAFGAGPLWSFLAYDIVLFIPYFQMLFKPPSASGGGYDDYGSAGGGINLTSLTVYLSVLTMSTALALYMFLFHPATRIGRRAT